VTREQELVQRLRGTGEEIVGAMTELVGGYTATAMRRIRTLPEPAFAALVEGLHDPHPRVRFHCLNVLDHVADPRVFDAIAPLLDDPVPRVRRQAAHSLGCTICKPDWCGTLPPGTVAALERLASDDPNARVRRDASIALWYLAEATGPDPASTAERADRR
jgi:HEAT repeat protein